MHAQHALASDGSTGGKYIRRPYRFSGKTAQKSRIMQAFLARIMLGVPEAFAIGL
jgi:hypothetical protein